MSLFRSRASDHVLRISDEEIAKVKRLLTRPTYEITAPKDLGERKLTHADRRDWIKQMRAMIIAMRAYLVWLPASWHMAEKLLTQVREQAQWFDEQTENDFPAVKDAELITRHNAVMRVYNEADMLKRIGGDSSYRMYAYASMCGLRPTISATIGGWQVTLLGQEFISVDSTVANELAISWMKQMWTQHQVVLDDLESECAQLLKMAQLGARRSVQLRLEWRSLQRELTQLIAQVAQLRMQLDTNALTVLDKTLLDLRLRAHQLGVNQPVQTKRAVLATTATGVVLAAGTGMGITVAGLGFQALLIGGAIEALAALPVAGYLIGTRRAKDYSTVPALTPESGAAEETWTQRLLAVLKEQDEEQAQVLTGPQLIQVQELQVRITHLLSGSAIALGPADQVRLERMVNEMLPTVVADFTALALVGEHQQEKAREDFAEMIQLLKTDTERLESTADEAAARKQTTYRNYLRDVLGHSELSLERGEKS